MMQVPRTRFARLLDAAFAHPRGLLGRLGGRIMGRTTRTRNAWTLELLHPQPDASILEVGCGPGTLLQVLAAHVASGQILGIDASPLMVQVATRRNQAEISQGLIRVQLGSAVALPADTESMDLALSANSVPFWQDQLAGVKEMHRVLKPGGRIGLILQPVWAKTDQEVREIGSELVALLDQAGFCETHLAFQPMRPIASVCSIGVKERA